MSGRVLDRDHRAPWAGVARGCAMLIACLAVAGGAHASGSLGEIVAVGTDGEHRGADGRSSAIECRASVEVDERIVTRDEAVSVALGRLHLRVAPRSDIRFWGRSADGALEIELVQGGLRVLDATREPQRLRIHTPSGLLRAQGRDIEALAGEGRSSLCEWQPEDGPVGLCTVLEQTRRVYQRVAEAPRVGLDAESECGSGFEAAALVSLEELVIEPLAVSALGEPDLVEGYEGLPGLEGGACEDAGAACAQLPDPEIAVPASIELAPPAPVCPPGAC